MFTLSYGLVGREAVKSALTPSNLTSSGFSRRISQVYLMLLASQM